MAIAVVTEQRLPHWYKTLDFRSFSPSQPTSLKVEIFSDEVQSTLFKSVSGNIVGTLFREIFRGIAGRGLAIFASPKITKLIFSSHYIATIPSSFYFPHPQLWMSGTTPPQAEQVSLALKSLSSNVSRDVKERANGFLESFQKSVSPAAIIWY